MHIVEEFVSQSIKKHIGLDSGIVPTVWRDIFCFSTYYIVLRRRLLIMLLQQQKF